MLKLTIKKIVLILFFTSILFLYAHNATRDIYSGDIGDLVTASYVFGVAHPPGYPLFTLLGYFLVKLPFSIPPVTKVGIISVLSSFTALILFFKYSTYITRSVLISLLTTSILAFSYLFWFHAEIPEVFAFNNFFIIALLYFSFLFYKEKKQKYLYITAFLAGLSLTHHHTILFILPTAFFLLITHIKYIFKQKRTVLLSFFFFFLGLTPYLYVPIAAATNPVVNWGNAVTLKNVIDLILRRDYGQFAPSIVNEVPIEYKGELLKIYSSELLNHYSILVCIFFLFGVIQLFKTDKKLCVLLLFAFLFSGPFFIYYGANYYTTSASLGVIERFYTLSFVVFIFLIPPGLLYLRTFLEKYHLISRYSHIIILFFFIIPLYMILYNFQRTDLSKTHIGNTFANDILVPLPKNSVLFVTSGDTTVFNVWYAHFALNIRPDIDIINPPKVGNNTFLDDEMTTYYKKNPQTKFNTLLAATVNDIAKKRKMYATSEQQLIPKDTVLVPKGLVLEFTPKNAIPSEANYIKEVEQNTKAYQAARLSTLSPAEQNLITTEIPMIYSNAFVRIGNFLLTEYKNPTLASKYFQKAMWYNEENSAAYAGMALAHFDLKNEESCDNAITYMKQAIDHYFIMKKYYTKLYSFYKECEANEETMRSFKENYKLLFKTDVDQEKL